MTVQELIEAFQNPSTNLATCKCGRKYVKRDDYCMLGARYECIGCSMSRVRSLGHRQ